MCQRHLSKTNSHLHQMQATKDFSVWRQACFIMAPKTGSKKLVVNTYAHASASQICLQNICGQQQNFPIWPHFWVQIWTPKRGPRGPYLDPKMGSPSENFVAARKCLASRFAIQLGACTAVDALLQSCHRESERMRQIVQFKQTDVWTDNGRVVCCE